MSTLSWSFVLQMARVGITAAVFLIAARFLTLSEIGLFGAVYAPMRIMQPLFRSGISEAAIITMHQEDGLFALSMVLGTCLAFATAIVAIVISGEIGEMLLSLCCLPLFFGLAAVAEGRLRRELKLRALALRTVISQLLAATSALILLMTGFGPWALAAFVLVNAAAVAIITLALARWWPYPSGLRLFEAQTARMVFEIAARDVAANALFPMAQMLVAGAFGLVAAGAFQIATRVFALLDSLTLAPFRFVALPQFAGLANRPDFLRHMHRLLLISALGGAAVWSLAYLMSGPLIAMVVGSEHAMAASPVFRALCPLGLVVALSIPFNQGLTAQGQTRLVLWRSVIQLGLGLGLASTTLALSVVHMSAALSVTAAMTFLWYVWRAAPTLGLLEFPWHVVQR